MTAETDTPDQLQSYFEKSTALVRDAVERVDHFYARPAFNYAVLSFQTRPITTTFLSVFLSLGFVPVTLFTIFSVYVLGAFVTTALIAALFASALTILAAGGILAIALFFVLFVALSATAGIISTFLALRLLMLVRTSGVRHGVSLWSDETRTRFRKQPSEQAVSTEKRAGYAPDEETRVENADTQSVASESASTVVVEAPSTPVYDSKDIVKLEN